MKARSPLVIFFCLFVLYARQGCAQSYGLGFYSHEVVQDERTGLDLSPGETLCFNRNFEISFDLTLFPSRKDYFGYVLRLVAGDRENIDLIYDRNAPEGKRFMLVTGEKFSGISFDIPPGTIFSKWNTLKLGFDFDKRLLRISNGKAVYQATVDLKKNSCFKVLFGANEYLGFKTTDVPPMKIRNVRIAEEGIEKYSWPLDEYEGQVAREKVAGKNALAGKPLWIKKLHYEWQPVLSRTVKGPASVAFDAKKELLYVVSDDSLVSYDVKRSWQTSTGYASGSLNLLRGSQSLVDPQGNLLTFYIDRHIASRFDFGTSRWTENYPKTNITDFWLYNKFYSQADSSLYTVGGYGHFIYKNQFHRYHFPSGNWQEVGVSGDTFTPRYLAALGQWGQGAYILGGYGSSSGQQMLNPRNLYDLLYFDAAEKTIRKVYELKIKGEDFVFANSMVIDDKSKVYYALRFPKNKYQSSLQLMEGSLSSPDFKLVGSPVPYLFHDVRSYADLFYSPDSRRFLAVTLYWEDNNTTRVKVYTLHAPPIGKQEEGHRAVASLLWYWMAGLLVLALAGLAVLLRKNGRSKARGNAGPSAGQVERLPDTAAMSGAEPGEAAENRNAVFLFGDMQVFDRTGNEITRQFTPIIRELFLVILLYSIRWERGISSEKLKELLWFDKSEESARNNRSVSIVKLRNILDQLDGCSISKDTGYWKLNLEPAGAYIDYRKYVSILRNRKKLDRQEILELSGIIKRGALLPNVSYEWLDAFKAEVSNEVIDSFLEFAHTIDIAADPELLVSLANDVFCFDPVNEEAMGVKCRALAFLGKHTQAKNAYEAFCKEYKLLYSVDFNKGFQDILGPG